MLEGEGTVFKVGKTSLAVRIPVDVVRDSQFPLKVGDKVTVKIKNGEIIIQKK